VVVVKEIMLKREEWHAICEEPMVFRAVTQGGIAGWLTAWMIVGLMRLRSRLSG